MAQQTNPVTNSTNPTGWAADMLDLVTNSTNPTSLTDPEPTPDPQTLRDDYYARQLEYEDMLKAFQTSQQNANYGWNRWNQGSNIYNQMEQQRESGSPYGNNRFYNQGEIYEYDPATGSYRGSISNRVIAQPTDYVQPELAPHPGDYDDWMASDPYYQELQEPSTQQPLSFGEWLEMQPRASSEDRPWSRVGASGAANSMWGLQEQVRRDRLREEYDDYVANRI
jgi:hypothetical protein